MTVIVHISPEAAAELRAALDKALEPIREFFRLLAEAVAVAQPHLRRIAEWRERLLRGNLRRPAPWLARPRAARRWRKASRR